MVRILPLHPLGFMGKTAAETGQEMPLAFTTVLRARAGPPV